MNNKQQEQLKKLEVLRLSVKNLLDHYRRDAEKTGEFDEAAINRLLDQLNLIDKLEILAKAQN